MKSSRIAIAVTPEEIRRCHPVMRECDRTTIWSATRVIDSLVLAASSSSAGRMGAKHGCENLELDFGVQRFAAHRFYLLERMTVSSYHFRVKISHEN